MRKVLERWNTGARKLAVVGSPAGRVLSWLSKAGGRRADQASHLRAELTENRPASWR